MLNGPACDGMSETLVVSNVCGYNQFATVPTTVLTNHAILSVYRHHPHSPGTEDAVVDPREVKRSTLCNTSQCGELIYPWGECISGGNLIAEGEGPGVWGTGRGVRGMGGVRGGGGGGGLESDWDGAAFCILAPPLPPPHPYPQLVDEYNYK